MIKFFRYFTMIIFALCSFSCYTHLFVKEKLKLVHKCCSIHKARKRVNHSRILSLRFAIYRIPIVAFRTAVNLWEASCILKISNTFLEESCLERWLRSDIILYRTICIQLNRIIIVSLIIWNKHCMIHNTRSIYQANRNITVSLQIATIIKCIPWF